MIVRVFESPEALARAAASRIAGLLCGAGSLRGACHLALSGGDSPVGTYRELATEPICTGVDWSRVRVHFTDERAVGPADPASNYRLAREALIEPAGIPPGNVHRMHGEAGDLEAAAAAYAAQLPPALDLVVLGIGEDGHTCSLFPGSPLLGEEERLVAAVLDSPRAPSRRLTLTPRAVLAARAGVLIALGGHKAEAVARALEQEGPVAEVPARLARDREWFLDAAAASRLRGAPAPETETV